MLFFGNLFTTYSLLMQILSFLAFTILVAVIAYLATRKTDEDSSDGYFLGGRNENRNLLSWNKRK